VVDLGDGWLPAGCELKLDVVGVPHDDERASSLAIVVLDAGVRHTEGFEMSLPSLEGR
jgi:hypothetical protein